MSFLQMYIRIYQGNHARCAEVMSSKQSSTIVRSEKFRMDDESSRTQMRTGTKTFEFPSAHQDERRSSCELWLLFLACFVNSVGKNNSQLPRWLVKCSASRYDSRKVVAEQKSLRIEFIVYVLFLQCYLKREKNVLWFLVIITHEAQALSMKPPAVPVTKPGWQIGLRLSLTPELSPANR